MSSEVEVDTRYSSIITDLLLGSRIVLRLDVVGGS